MEKVQRRKVLLLGNGILRAFSQESSSWKALLDANATNKTLEGIGKDVMDVMPLPLCAVLQTDDRVDELCGSISGKMERSPVSEELAGFIKSLAALGFDDILTTNYGYEIEAALCGRKIISEKGKMQKSQSHTEAVGRCEPKYMLHTYYDCPCGEERSVRVWHIHGEARKKDSIIIGHYYYGSLLSRYQEYFRSKRNGYADDIKNGVRTKYSSWLDSFILGDVYVLGFGFDLSEFDMWWLVNRKKRENASHGKTVFYEPDGAARLKHMLLCSYGCEHRPLGYCNISESEYKEFYLKALDDIKSDIAEKAPALV